MILRERNDLKQFLPQDVLISFYLDLDNFLTFWKHHKSWNFRIKNGENYGKYAPEFPRISIPNIDKKLLQHFKKPLNIFRLAKEDIQYTNS
jgi:hypothetical protein